MIQSLREGKLLKLGGELASQFYDESLEDIVEDIQGVKLPQKSKRYQEMMEAAEKYYLALNDSENQDDIDSLKEKLDELMVPFSDDPAFIAQLKFDREVILNKKESD